jgi:hypothetical protein
MKTNIFLAFLFIALTTSINSQSILQQINTNGKFHVQDINNTSNDFFTVDYNTGHLNIFSGAIFKGADRFIHNYQAPGKDGQNTFVGINSGNFTMGGGQFSSYASYNTGVGYSSLSSLTSGPGNSAFGSSALQKVTIGAHNSAFGYLALQNNLLGEHNSAFGIGALFSNLQSNNSAFGSNALYANTYGTYNSAFGQMALSSNSTGNENSSFGRMSLANNTIANRNSAFGYWSLRDNTIGQNNSAFGSLALFINLDGSDNSAFGNSALANHRFGDGNSSFGSGALANGHTIPKNYNSAFGYSALHTDGDYNSAFGANAGFNGGNLPITGSNNTLIGYNALPSSLSVSNEITFGNSSVTTIRANVQSITSLSDERDKKNIKELNLGIDFLMKVKPRLFNWDKREWYDNNASDGSKMSETPTAGFIAQEFDELQTSENTEWLNLVLKSNPDKFEATSGNLLPIMVKAIQDLKKENDELKSKNANIQVVNEKLQSATVELSQKLNAFEMTQAILISEIEKLKTSKVEFTQLELETK